MLINKSIYFCSHNDFAKVQRLVFDLADKDIVEYSNLVQFNHDLGEELEAKIFEKVRKTIYDHFLQAEAVLKVSGMAEHLKFICATVIIQTSIIIRVL